MYDLLLFGLSIAYKNMSVHVTMILWHAVAYIHGCTGFVRHYIAKVIKSEK